MLKTFDITNYKFCRKDLEIRKEIEFSSKAQIF